MIGQGVVPDDSPQLVGAARSSALAGADTVLLLGARLNWMLHFGQPPRWAHGQTDTNTDRCRYIGDTLTFLPYLEAEKPPD